MRVFYEMKKKREQKQIPFPLTALLSERNTCDRLPLFQYLEFTCCEVSQAGEYGNERLNIENQSRVVGEVDVDVVMTGLGIQFNAFNGLAFGLFKVDVACVLFESFVSLFFSHLCTSLHEWLGRRSCAIMALPARISC